MTTEGTALQGLLQQEREALEREKAAAAEDGSADLVTEVKTDPNDGCVKKSTEASGLAGVEAAQATDGQHVREAVKV